MGAWIEIDSAPWEATGGTSHPVWVRGLKYVTKSNFACNYWVAPLVGAWIEIVSM